MTDTTAGRHGAHRAHRDLLEQDRRRERSVLWRFLLAAAVTVALALARHWWWV